MVPRQRLAFLLWDLADLVQADERRRSFRAKAYRTALWSLDRLSEQLDDPEETMLAVPGLGRGMVRLIAEFRSDGRLAELEDLAGRYPADADRLRRLPRMTPSILRGLKADAGVERAHDLSVAIETGGASLVRGVGPATAERWLELLEGWPTEGVPAHRGWVLATMMSEHLGSLLETRVAIGGQVRRITEWVDQIDLLVESEQHSEARRFLRSSVIGVPRDEAGGPDSLRLVTPFGIGLNVDLSTAAGWGSDLIRITGPEAHVEGLGLRGVFESEEAAYDAVGTVWIPPPARESVLPVSPTLIRNEMIRGDLHVHSSASPDGRMSLDEIVDTLVARGYEYGAVTDHTAGLRFGGLDGEGLRRQHSEIERVRSRHQDFVLFHGAEVNIARNGFLDLDDDTLDGLDFVVAGVHSHFDLPDEDQTNRIVRALSHPAVRVLAHPTGRRIGLRNPLRLDLERLITAAAEHGVALEANGHRDRLDVSANLARMARESGSNFASNSDAHRVGEFANVENGVATLQRAGVGRGEVVNALPLADFVRWLDR